MCGPYVIFDKDLEQAEKLIVRKLGTVVVIERTAELVKHLERQLKA